MTLVTDDALKFLYMLLMSQATDETLLIFPEQSNLFLQSLCQASIKEIIYTKKVKC